MDITRRPLLALIALAFIVGALVLFGFYEQSARFAYDAFVTARANIVRNDFAAEQNHVRTAYAAVFADCTDRSRYNAFINMDSRQMTARELTDALALHAACGNHFVDMDTLALDFFGRDVAHLKTLSSLFPGISTRTRAKDVADVWGGIYDLEKEKIDTDARLVAIQKAYWEIERDKVHGTISPAERETRIGVLNTEARAKLVREEEIFNSLQTLRQKESTLFSESFSEERIHTKEETK